MEKTYVFDSAESNNTSAILASLMQNRGVDPNLMALLSNASKNQDAWGGSGCWFMWVIILFWLWGGNRGFGNNNLPDGIPNQLNNDFGREVLLQAINGNGNAISQLATNLNCDINSVKSVLSNIQGSIGLNGQQIINAIQSGNASIASQLASCCCDVRTAITTQGYEGRLATLDQTKELGSKIDMQTTLINDKFCQLEMRDMQAKINQLQEEKSTLLASINNSQQTAQIQGYIASVISPIAQEVNAIKAAQPNTVTLPYSCATAVPTNLAYQLYADLYANRAASTSTT